MTSSVIHDHYEMICKAFGLDDKATGAVRDIVSVWDSTALSKNVSERDAERAKLANPILSKFPTIVQGNIKRALAEVIAQRLYRRN